MYYTKIICTIIFIYKTDLLNYYGFSVESMSIKGYATNSGGKKHPIHEKQGITEDKLGISVKGNNDKIEVKIDPKMRGNLNNLGRYFRFKNKPVEIVNISEVKNLAEKRHSHFFDVDTMRFFKSRISDEAYKFGDKIYFITSESGPSGIRKWTTRYITKDGNIETFGKFQEHASLLDARRAIRDFIEEK